MRRDKRAVIWWSLALVLALELGTGLFLHVRRIRRNAPRTAAAWMAEAAEQLAMVHIPPKGPLPDECKPWQAAPPSVSVDPVKLGITVPGEDARGFECWTSGICDYKSISNADDYARDHLWTKTPEGQRAPYGGSADCDMPRTAMAVRCHVNVNDRGLNQVMVIHLTCSGRTRCDKSEKCCRQTGQEYKEIPYIPASETSIKAAEREMADRRWRRYEICRPYCKHPAFADKCSDYWDHL